MRFDQDTYGQVVLTMSIEKAELLYSELCDTTEVPAECDESYNCQHGEACKGHPDIPMLYLSPSIVELHKGLEDLFPDEEEES